MRSTPRGPGKITRRLIGDHVLEHLGYGLPTQAPMMMLPISTMVSRSRASKKTSEEASSSWIVVEELDELLALIFGEEEEARPVEVAGGRIAPPC